MPLPFTLTKNNLDFSRPKGRNLLKRTEDFHAWVSARRSEHLWPFTTTTLQTAPTPRTKLLTDDGQEREAINFASQDYLSLSSHPRVKTAMKDALDQFGAHSAGSPVLQGNTTPSKALEAALADTLQLEHVVLFPTGWAAGFGSVAGLVRAGDVIVTDQLAHACLQTGAAAATSNIIRHKHLQVEQIPEILAKVRGEGHEGGILVITEGLFSMDSDVPQLAGLQEVCHEYDATLLVDVAHDFGAMGPQGGGALALQGLVGKIDLVMGSFSKTFASNGGFLATRSAAVRDYLRMFGNPHTFSNALSPVQAAVVLECLRIVRSTEGDQRRARMLTVSRRLRDELSARGVQCIGEPSAIVPAFIGTEALARLAIRRLRDRNVFANMVEFPGVAVSKARFRLQVMSDHEVSDAVAAADAVAGSINDAKSDLAAITGTVIETESPRCE
jgi:glycine C-acetyltransferase/8-amino-7-oxononanoate synthase